jgi:outer membrane protein assembly factor BamD (BamD/ComL family)
MLKRLPISLVLLAALAWPAIPASAAWPNWFGDEPQVGTSEWWQKHKDEAQFVVGQGYQVPGVDGYFDQDGHPMDGPVAVERIASAAKEKSDDGLVPWLDPKAQWGKLKEAVGFGPDEQSARTAFAEGQKLFAERRYGAAAKQFKEAVARGVNSPVEQEAMYMLAESYFFDDRYIKARDAYNALADKYPNTSHMDTLVEREWKIARYWEQFETYAPDWPMTPNFIDKTRPRLDTIGHSVKTYDNIRMNDPTGPRADDAIMARANVEFQRSRYDDADYYYTLLRKEYPRSEHQYEAHLLGLQAKLRKYQGSDYDGTPLEEAKTLVKQLRLQFAGQLSGEERERLRLVEGQLSQEIAARDMRMAKFYDDTKHYRAAKYYYAQLIQRHPDSELAQQARERVAQIAGEPDDPPKRLAWLVDLVPESRERTAVARIPELKNGGRLARAPDSTATPAQATTAR